MKTSESKVTAFIVTYNRIEYLKKAIHSVLNQTCRDFELIVLDNCSTDETEEYVTSLNDERITYVRHEKNIGGGGNIAYAFAHCRGDYFAVFHDDDILHTDLLEEEVAYLDSHNECTAVSCLPDIIDENGCYSRITDETKAQARTFSGSGFFSEYINCQRNFVFPATLYRTAFIKEKQINITFAAGPCADVVVYMDIEKAGGTVAEIPKVLIDYRVYKNQDSSAHLEEMLIKLIQFLAKDAYYGQLLRRNLQGRKRYLQWYFRRLLAREASGCIDGTAAQDYFDRMNEVLNAPSSHANMYRFALRAAGRMPDISNLAYKTAKKVKQKL